MTSWRASKPRGRQLKHRLRAPCRVSRPLRSHLRQLVTYLEPLEAAMPELFDSDPAG